MLEAATCFYVALASKQDLVELMHIRVHPTAGLQRPKSQKPAYLSSPPRQNWDHMHGNGEWRATTRQTQPTALEAPPLISPHQQS